MLSALRNSSRPRWIFSIKSLTGVDEDGVTTLSFLSVLPALSVLYVLGIGMPLFCVLGVGVPLFSFLSLLSVLSVLSAEVSSPLGIGVGVTVGVAVVVTFWNGGAGIVVMAGSILLFS